MHAGMRMQTDTFGIYEYNVAAFFTISINGYKQHACRLQHAVSLHQYIVGMLLHMCTILSAAHVADSCMSSYSGIAIADQCV